MLIKTDSTGFRATRMIVATAAGLGTGTLTKAALFRIGFVPKTKFQLVTTFVAAVAIGAIASSAVKKATEQEIDDAAAGWNGIFDAAKSFKVSVVDENTGKGE